MNKDKVLEEIKKYIDSNIFMSFSWYEEFIDEDTGCALWIIRFKYFGEDESFVVECEGNEEYFINSFKRRYSFYNIKKIAEVLKRRPASIKKELYERYRFFKIFFDIIEQKPIPELEMLINKLYEYSEKELSIIEKRQKIIIYIKDVKYKITGSKKGSKKKGNQCFVYKVYDNRGEKIFQSVSYSEVALYLLEGKEYIERIMRPISDDEILNIVSSYLPSISDELDYVEFDDEGPLDQMESELLNILLVYNFQKGFPDFMSNINFRETLFNQDMVEKFDLIGNAYYWLYENLPEEARKVMKKKDALYY